MVVFKINFENGTVSTDPAVIPQGSSQVDFVVLGGYDNSQCILRIEPPTGEYIADIVAKPGKLPSGELDTRFSVGKLPDSVFSLEGKAKYQIMFVERDQPDPEAEVGTVRTDFGETTLTNTGSFTISRSVRYNMPETVGQLENYTIDQIYDLLADIKTAYTGTSAVVDSMSPDSGVIHLRAQDYQVEQDGEMLSYPVEIEDFRKDDLLILIPADRTMDEWISKAVQDVLANDISGSGKLSVRLSLWPDYTPIDTTFRYHVIHGVVNSVETPSAVISSPYHSVPHGAVTEINGQKPNAEGKVNIEVGTGTGTVKTVAWQTPDEFGNVALTADDIGAIPNSKIADTVGNATDKVVSQKLFTDKVASLENRITGSIFSKKIVQTVPTLEEATPDTFYFVGKAGAGENDNYEEYFCFVDTAGEKHLEYLGAHGGSGGGGTTVTVGGVAQTTWDADTKLDVLENTAGVGAAYIVRPNSREVSLYPMSETAAPWHIAMYNGEGTFILGDNITNPKSAINKGYVDDEIAKLPTRETIADAVIAHNSSDFPHPEVLGNYAKKDELTPGGTGSDAAGTAQTLVDAHNASENPHPEIITGLRNEITRLGQHEAPRIVDKISQMTDTTKQYVLKSDGMIYQYTAVPSYTNVLAKSDTSIFPKNQEMLAPGIAKDVRYGGDNSLTPQAGCNLSGRFPITKGQIIRFKNFTIKSNVYLPNYTGVHAYNSAGSYIRIYSATDLATPGDGASWKDKQFDGQGSLIQARFTGSGVSYFSVGGSTLNEDSVVTIDEPITDAVSYKWLSTGRGYTPIPNEDRILALETSDNQQNAKITNLRHRVENLEAGEEPPAFWNNEIADTIAEIRVNRDEVEQAGHTPYTFAWITDPHIAPGGSQFLKNIGTVANKVMKSCGINRLIVNGDIWTASTMSLTGANAEQTVLSSVSYLLDYLRPVPLENVSIIEGNHDFYYNNSPAEGHYTAVVPLEKQFRRVFRPQENSFRKIFDETGTQKAYWYDDDAVSRIRSICLWSGHTETPLTEGEMTHSGGLGEEQRAWLQSEALNLPGTWKAIIFVHVPPTDRVGAGYSGYYHDYTQFRQILADNAGKILCIFATHAHADFIYDGHGKTYALNHTSPDSSLPDDEDVKIPIITMTCAANAPYRHPSMGIPSTTARESGEPTETALDFVTVDRDSGAVYLARCGVDFSRKFTPIA